MARHLALQERKEKLEMVRLFSPLCYVPFSRLFERFKDGDQLIQPRAHEPLLTLRLSLPSRPTGRREARLPRQAPTGQSPAAEPPSPCRAAEPQGLVRHVLIVAVDPSPLFSPLTTSRLFLSFHTNSPLSSSGLSISFSPVCVSLRPPLFVPRCTDLFSPFPLFSVSLEHLRNPISFTLPS